MGSARFNHVALIIVVYLGVWVYVVILKVHPVWLPVIKRGTSCCGGNPGTDYNTV